MLLERKVERYPLSARQEEAFSDVVEERWMMKDLANSSDKHSNDDSQFHLSL